MRYGETFTLYRKDGTEVVAREYYTNPNDTLAEALVTNDGRIVLDQGNGQFCFKDSHEELYPKPPA
jgi:hypothetical protein